MKAKLHYVFTLTIFLIAFSAISQNSWKKIETPKNPELITKLKLDKSKVDFLLNRRISLIIL